MENEGKRISSYVRDILSGRPIADIPKSLILKVHDAFIKNKDKYNISNIKYIKITQEFENVEKRFRLNKKEVRSTVNNQVLVPQYCNIIVDKDDKAYKNDNVTHEKNEMESILTKLINGGSFEIIETESIDYMIEYCKQKIEQFVKENEFDKASSHQKLLDELIQLSYERKYLSLMMAKKKGNFKQIELFKQQIDEEKQKIKDENEKIDQETFYLLQLEEEEWAQFLLQFDNETNRGPPPKFLKLSAKLLNLKQVEKSMIKSKRFEEASKIHEILSQLEEKELNNQYKIFMDERKNKKDQLTILHQARIQGIQSHAERKKASIELKNQTKIDSLNNAIRNLLVKEKDINNLIVEEKKAQDDEINSNLMITKNVSQVNKKKRKIPPKHKKTEKNVKRVHFDKSIFK